MKAVLITLSLLISWLLLRSPNSESAVKLQDVNSLPSIRIQTKTSEFKKNVIHNTAKNDYEGQPTHIREKIIESSAEREPSQSIETTPLTFSPYKAEITPKDSPLGQLPSNIKEITALPNLNHFDSAPSLRFLSGNFIGVFQTGDRPQVVRLAIFFKDNNLDELSPLTCAGVLQGTQSTSISGNLQSNNIQIRFMNGRNENQKSLVLVIEDKLVLHIWQLDKREKSLWAKIYEQKENGELKEIGYSQLVPVQNLFKSCAGLK